MKWKLNGWSLLIAAMAGFLVAAVIDDWWIMRHGGLVR